MLGYYCQSAALATVVEMPQVEVHTATYFLFVTAAADQPLTASCSQTIQIIMTRWFETVSGEDQA